jgi:hypothetical protein
MASTKIIIDAIKKILTDLSKLDDEQLAQVVDGTLEFKCEPTKKPSSRKSPEISQSKGAFDKVFFEQYKEKILASTSRVSAMEYLKALNLKVAELKEFANYLELRKVPSKKEDIVKFIVDNTIGFRLDAQGYSKINHA